MTSSGGEIRLSGLIIPKLQPVHRALKTGETPYIWLPGGRGSTKTAFSGLEAILEIKRNPQANVVFLRKVANTLRESSFASVQQALGRLGVEHEFKVNHSRLELTYIPTGQKIYFRGVDKPAKLKSMTTTSGRFTLVVFEEADQFAGEEEVRTVLQTFLRGEGTARVLYLFNPPKTRNHWINRAVREAGPSDLVVPTSYLDVPAHWLGSQFFEMAETLRETNEMAYRHEYLGEATGTGGAVFDNLRIESIPSAVRATFDRVLCGVDWGYFPDPWRMVRCHYAAAQRTLYLFDEATAFRASNKETAAIVTDHIGPGERVTCDSSEIKSVDDYRARGIRARAAIKGPGSVQAGTKWLQSLAAIVIDPDMAPESAREFTEYEYEKTPAGEYYSSLPDRDNHSIDGTRYATEQTMGRRSNRA